MARDCHGLKIGMRVREDGAEVIVKGRIEFLDEETGTATIQWDNGHYGDCDVDVLIPVGGWKDD